MSDRTSPPSDRDTIEDTARAVVKTLNELRSPGMTERILQRLHDAKRGFPSGGEPPPRRQTKLDPATGRHVPVEESDEEGSATTYSDRTGTLAFSRDDATRDLKALLEDVDRLWRTRASIQRTIERWGQVHPNHRCVECSAAGWMIEADRGRYRDRCRFHGEALRANEGRPTPIAITEAHHQRRLTDRVIANNPIVVLDEDGNDTGRRVPWRRKVKGAAA